MSTTYSLVCDECKVKQWIGQSGYLYCVVQVQDFLNDHVGHAIRYVCDLVDDESIEGYKEADDDK